MILRAGWWDKKRQKLDSFRNLVFKFFLTKCTSSSFLSMLGYTPIVLPFSQQSNFQMVVKTIAKMLKAENVSLPNLDDGYREKNRRF